MIKQRRKVSSRELLGLKKAHFLYKESGLKIPNYVEMCNYQWCLGGIYVLRRSELHLLAGVKKLFRLAD